LLLNFTTQKLEGIYLLVGSFARVFVGVDLY